MLPPRHQRHARKLLWRYWPRRILGERTIVWVLLLGAIALLAVNQFSPQLARRMETGVFESSAGILSFLSFPAQKLNQTIDHVMGLSDMSSDLASLREENIRLKQWYDRARQLEAENRSLRGLVNLADLPRAHYVSARVIAIGGTAFADGVVVDAGTRQGVNERMVAMTGNGLVGRVISVSEDTAHVILLNDSNARVPIVIENSRHRGVLAGDNTDLAQILHLPEEASVTVGERVLTSGLGGIFVAGLPVGVIAKMDTSGIRVKPFADLQRLEIIQLIDFGQHDPSAQVPHE